MSKRIVEILQLFLKVQSALTFQTISLLYATSASINFFKQFSFLVWIFAILKLTKDIVRAHCDTLFVLLCKIHVSDEAI
jgi:hypothetical protein